jgi:hypothetical protein
MNIAGGNGLRKKLNQLSFPQGMFIDVGIKERQKERLLLVKMEKENYQIN